MGLADDQEATAKAARTAKSAADLAESRGHGIEMTDRRYGNELNDTSASGSQQPESLARAHARGQSSGSINISGDLSKETAAAAVKKLAGLRGESQRLRSHDEGEDVSYKGTA